MVVHVSINHGKQKKVMPRTAKRVFIASKEKLNGSKSFSYKIIYESIKRSTTASVLQ